MINVQFPTTYSAFLVMMKCPSSTQHDPASELREATKKVLRQAGWGGEASVAKQSRRLLDEASQFF